MKSHFFDLLFPFHCASCAKEGILLCDRCRQGLRPLFPSCFCCGRIVFASGHVPSGRTCFWCRKKSYIYAFFSPFSYGDETVRQLIHTLKYERLRAAAPLLGQLLGCFVKENWAAALGKSAIIAPVPLHKIRERRRGFNQADLIARVCASELGFAYCPHLLLKTRNTAPQVGLAGTFRRANLSGVFSVADPARVKDAVVVLVDDVKTTGATLEEAARVLKIAGAKKIIAATVAR